MFDLDSRIIVLLGIRFFAAFVNGALGYGFSSLTVPVALVLYTNRFFNRALIAFDQHQKEIRGTGAYVDNATCVMLGFARPYLSQLMLIYSIGIDAGETNRAGEGTETPGRGGWPGRFVS